MKDFTSFRDRLVTDSAFLEKYSGQKDAERIVAMAKEDGYEFTKEDLLQSTDVSNTELSVINGGLDGFDLTGVSGSYVPYDGIIGVR